MDQLPDIDGVDVDMPQPDQIVSIDPETGDAIVDLEPYVDNPDSSGFYENLAEFLIPSDALDEIATEELENIESDEESRKDFLEIKAQRLEKSGFDQRYDERSQPFVGASAAVHPLLSQCATDMSARIMKELWGNNGPVRTQVVGEKTEDKLDQATRVEEFMRLQLTTLIKGYREQEDIMMAQLPFDGDAFKKTFWDDSAKTIQSLYVKPEDLILPYHAESLDTAERITHRFYMSKREVRRAMASGLYRSVPLNEPANDDQNAVDTANDRIQGKKPSVDKIDNRFEILECHCYLDISAFDPFAGDSTDLPYVVTIERHTRKVLSVYRNWSENDPRRERKETFTAYIMQPWKGPYGIGLPHQIGSLSDAATGTLRALLDAGMLSNTSIWAMMDNAGVDAQRIELEPNSIVRIKAKAMPQARVGDILQRLDFAPPNQTLFELLGFLVQAGKDFANVNLGQISDMSPSGTSPTAVLALLEEGANVFNAIFSRIRAAKAKELQILFRLNSEHLEDSKTLKTFKGELVVRKDDFDDGIDVLPSADETVGSTTKRMAQNQLLLDMAEKYPDIIDKRKVLKRSFESAGISDVDELLVKPLKDPIPRDPVSNFIAASNGDQVQLFPGQDPDLHLNVYLQILQDPCYGMNPMTGPQIVQILTPLVQQCMVARLGKMYGAAIGGVVSVLDQMAPGQVPVQYLQMFQDPTSIFGQDLPQDVGNVLTRLMSADGVTRSVLKADQILFEKAGPIIDSVMNQMPKPPANPDEMYARAQQEKVRSDHETKMLNILQEAERIQSDERIAENSQAQANLRSFIATLKSLPPGVSLFGHLPSDVPDEVAQLLMDAQRVLQQTGQPKPEDMAPAPASNAQPDDSQPDLVPQDLAHSALTGNMPKPT